MTATNPMATRATAPRMRLVARPRDMPRRARRLVPGSIASAMNSEMTSRRKNPKRRSHSSCTSTVPRKPSHSKKIARGTQRGMAEPFCAEFATHSGY